MLKTNSWYSKAKQEIELILSISIKYTYSEMTSFLQRL